MTRDPFLRLALIAAVTVWAVGLVVVARFLGWPAAVSAGVVGVLVAAALTVEMRPEEKPPAAEVEADPRRRLRQPGDGTRGFQRVG